MCTHMHVSIGQIRHWLCLGTIISLVQLGFALSDFAGKCTQFGPRFECGHGIKDSSECESNGCCWAPTEELSHFRTVTLPPCFTSNGGGSSYRLLPPRSRATGGGDLKGILQHSTATQPELGPDIGQLSVSLDHIAPDIVRIKVADVESSRWQVPQKQLFGDQQGLQGPGGSPEDALHIEYDQEPFSVTVKQKGAAIVRLDGRRFLFKEQYLEVNTIVPEEAALFGVGERTPSQGLRLPRDGLPLTLWNRDLPSAQADTNLYGSHPFIMMLMPDGSACGLLLMNSNAMEVSLTTQGISWRTIGGIVDLYVMGGPTPGRVLEQLTRLVGRPHMPPYWSLGFHQCKWGYRSIGEVSEVVTNYSAAGIPLQTMWTDIDYMDGWRDFTNDLKVYPLSDFRALVDKLHDAGQHWIPIVDPGIKVEAGDAAYDDGIALDIFLKDSIGNPYVGQVWPGAVHYPDFTHPRSQQWWQEHLSTWHEKLPFDGLWIDMNEVSNFCTGDVCEVPAHVRGEEQHLGHHANAFQDDPTVCFLKCRTTADALSAANRTDPRLLQVSNPPYKISNGNERLPLGLNTAATSTRHHDGTLQYDSHNLYGLQQSRVTHDAMSHISGMRPFVLSRSTFLGSGQWAGHWTGDNGATWEDLRWSVTAVLNSGLFGIPFAGADICGFIGNTTEELCNRWISAGAFYPFSRDHSGAYDGYQELYRWQSVAQAGRRALGMRYRLLPYLYTAFYEGHTSGAPVARPMFWMDAEDGGSLSADGQWLLGASVAVSPVLTEGAISVAAYFPRGVWYSLWDDSIVDVASGGSWRKLAAPLGEVPLHVRGGAVIPMQDAEMTTAAVHSSPLTLLVALAPDLQAVDQSLLHRWTAATVQRLRQVARLMLTLASSVPAVNHTDRARLRVARDMLSQTCPKAGSMSASGWMYRDEGDPLQVPRNLDNFLTFKANQEAPQTADTNHHSTVPTTVPTTKGSIMIRFGREGSSGAGGPIGGGCTGISWPQLDTIRVLGVRQHVGTLVVAVTVIPQSDSSGNDDDKDFVIEGGNRSSQFLSASQIDYNATSGVLLLTAMSTPLKCPHALRVSWSSLPPVQATTSDEL